jgi:protein-S-isoprenylcysteine O-methyltransferase Ste14
MTDVKGSKRSRRIVMVLGLVVVQGVVLFSAAGTVTWLRAWGYLGLFVSILVCMGIVLSKVNPQLIGHRGTIKAGTKRFDKIFYTIFLPVFYGMLTIAGLDAVRFEWSFMPHSLVVVGVGTGLLGYSIVLWAMAVNAHFESTVRIQNDRGHRVCTRGPYQYVRHPGYIGMILMYTGIPFILGSWWAFIPAFALSVFVVIRARLEDATLQKELPGYTVYAKKTQFRLVPGIW